jgi:transposase
VALPAETRGGPRKNEVELGGFSAPDPAACWHEGAKMARRPRRNHSPAFRVKVALAALKGEKTMSELATQFDFHLNQIKQWKDQLPDGVTEVV